MSFQALLDYEFLNNTIAVWLRATLFFAVMLGGLLLVKRVVIKRLQSLAKLTTTDIDDLVVGLLAKTKFLFLLAVSLAAGSAALERTESVTDVVEVVVVVAFFVQGIIWTNVIITYWVAKIAADQAPEDQGNVAIIKAMGTVARFLVFLALFLVALNTQVNVLPLLTGLGIGGIALALAVQSTLGDLLAAVSILVDKPFTVGDFVIVDDLKGTIEHIGLKTTRVRSLGGEQIVFSNADLLQSRIRNYKRMLERRIAFTTGVTYQTPHEQLRRIPEMVKEIVEAQSPVRFERCHFLKYADSWLEYETIYWVLVPDYMVYADIQQAINLELYRRFGEMGIDFAYPTRTLFVTQENSQPAT